MDFLQHFAWIQVQYWHSFQEVSARHVLICHLVGARTVWSLKKFPHTIEPTLYNLKGKKLQGFIFWSFVFELFRFSMGNLIMWWNFAFVSDSDRRARASAVTISFGWKIFTDVVVGLVLDATAIFGYVEVLASSSFYGYLLTDNGLF